MWFILKVHPNRSGLTTLSQTLPMESFDPLGRCPRQHLNSPTGVSCLRRPLRTWKRYDGGLRPRVVDSTSETSPPLPPFHSPAPVPQVQVEGGRTRQKNLHFPSTERGWTDPGSHHDIRFPEPHWGTPTVSYPHTLGAPVQTPPLSHPPGPNSRTPGPVNSYVFSDVPTPPIHSSPVESGKGRTRDTVSPLGGPTNTESTNRLPSGETTDPRSSQSST